MADDADLDAIRQWVASGGQMGVDAAGNPVVPASVVDQPPPAAPAAPTPATAQPTPGQTAAEQRAAQREADRQADRQQRAADRAAREQAQRRKRTGNIIGRIGATIGGWAANVPTPGGNLALVLILLFFAFAIIPVNSGQTRLQLIWDVLTGNADLPGAGAASGPTASGSAQVAGGVASGIGGVFSTIGTGAQGVLSGIGGAVGGSGGGPGGPNAAGYIPPQDRSGAGLLEPPRG